MENNAENDADRRRRRRYRTAVVASLVVVASLAVVAVVVAVGSNGRRSPVRTPSPAPVVFDLATARPVEEVWPGAVRRLPRRLPDGRAYTPRAQLDEDRFVVVPSRGNAYELPVVYDVRAGRVVELIAERPPSDTVVGFATASVTDRDIVLAVPVRGRHEVWVAPRAGGPATRRTVFEDVGKVSAFGVGDVVFAVVTTETPAVVTTVHRLPAGGSPERVATADGVPESPYDRWFMTGPPASSGPATDPFTFVDVVTGERRVAARFDGLTGTVCSPDVCAGFQNTDLVAYRFDGTGPARITGLTARAREFSRVITGTGRFIGVRDGELAYLWDREKNIAVQWSLGFVVGQLQLLRYSDDAVYVVDLSRIP